jgi:hypothetical protein
LQLTIDLTPFPPAAHETLAEISSRLVDDGALLLAATGSLADSSWKADWSDIDLLLIRRDLPVDWLADRTQGMTARLPAHVSAFSAAEVSKGLLTPRLINAIRLIEDDNRGIIARDHTWKLPHFTLHEGARASLLDLPQTLLLLRRHAMDGVGDVHDVRAAYKLAILVARITLRQEGIEPDTADDVAATFARRHAITPRWLPNTEEVATARDTPDIIESIRTGIYIALELADAWLSHNNSSQPGGRS